MRVPKEDWGFLNEKAFEAALQASVPERLPDKVAAVVTPWKRAMGRVLAGTALTALGTNLWGLNYLLPGFGLVLMLLGFRLLRWENRWFRCCFLLTGMQLAYCVFQLILQATPYQAAYAASTVGLVLPYLNALLQLAQGFCLWRGLLAVQLLELGFPDYVLPAPAAGGDRGLSWGHTGGGQRSGVRPGGRLLPKQRLQPAVHNRGRGEADGRACRLDDLPPLSLEHGPTLPWDSRHTALAGIPVG